MADDRNGRAREFRRVIERGGGRSAYPTPRPLSRARNLLPSFLPSFRTPAMED